MYIFYFWIGIFLLTVAGGESSLIEKKLVDHLLDKHDTNIRPGTNASWPVNVTLSITVIQILDLNEKEDTLKAVLWQTMIWDDPTLTWNPSEYENISDIRILESKIWKPDIHAYNIAVDEHNSIFETHAVVQSNGNIVVVQPSIHVTTCRILYRNFPFDQQKCEIKFGSWTESMKTVDLHLQNGNQSLDVSSYIEHDLWSLTETNARRETVHYACCPDGYVSLTFMLTLKRKGDVILGIAKIINVSIIVALLISWLIPPSSISKIPFAITPFATTGLTLFMYTTKYPNFAEDEGRLSSLSLLSYFKVLWALTLFGLILNVFTYWLHRFTTDTPTPIQRIMKSKIPKLLLINIKLEEIYDNEMDQIELIGDSSNASNTQPRRTRIWPQFAFLLDRFIAFVFTILIFIIWISIFPSYN